MHVIILMCLHVPFLVGRFLNAMQQSQAMFNFFFLKMFGGRYVVIRGPPKDIYIVLVLKFFSTYY